MLEEEQMPHRVSNLARRPFVARHPRCTRFSRRTLLTRDARGPSQTIFSRLASLSGGSRWTCSREPMGFEQLVLISSNNFGSLAWFAIDAVLPLAALVSLRTCPSRRTGVSRQSGRTFDAGLADLSRRPDAAGRTRLAGAASLAVLPGGPRRPLKSWLALFSGLTGQSSQSHLEMRRVFESMSEDHYRVTMVV